MITQEEERAIAERILSQLTARQFFCLKSLSGMLSDWQMWVLTGIERQHPELLEWSTNHTPMLSRVGVLVTALHDVGLWQNQDDISLHYYGSALEITWRIGSWTGAIRMMESPLPQEFTKNALTFQSAEEREELRSFLRLLTRMPKLAASWQEGQCQFVAQVANSNRHYFVAVDSSDTTIAAETVICTIANILLARGVV